MVISVAPAGSAGWKTRDPAFQRERRGLAR